jgi:lipopolysaccharide transport system permease protein
MQQVTVIEPNRRWFHIPVREIFDYRDLLLVMVARDFTARYKQTILGPLWFFISPLVTTLVFTVVFNRVAKIPTDSLPPVLFYMCGNLAWSFFSGCFSSSANTLTANAGLFGKVYFPRLIVPLSKAVSGLFSFGIQLLSFACFWVYFAIFTPAGGSIHLRWAVLLLPLFVIEMMALAIGVGLLMSSLSAKYRDFAYIMGFLSSMWFYATPVVYPLSQVSAKWRWIYAINPMSGVVEVFRHALLGTGTVSASQIGLSVALTAVLFVIGVVSFNRAERTFIDTV